MARVQIIITADNGQRVVVDTVIREDLLRLPNCDAMQDAAMNHVSTKFIQAYSHLFRSKQMTPSELRHRVAHENNRLIPISPSLGSHWLQQRFRERNCSDLYGHCYHSGQFIDWFCCMCGNNVDGMPEQNCTICASTSEEVSK